MDARSVLGVRPLRPSFLDDLSAAEARCAAGRRAEIHDRACLVTKSDNALSPMRRYSLDDDDEDDDEVEDDIPDSDHDDGDDEDEEDEDEEETWQVSAVPLNVGLHLTSSSELPRLAPICQPFGGLDKLSRPRVPTAL